MALTNEWQQHVSLMEGDGVAASLCHLAFYNYAGGISETSTYKMTSGPPLTALLPSPLS